VDSQQQENHDRDLTIARNEAKREFFSDVRLSTWATAIALVVALAALTIYLIRK
jgi:fatty acid desaturase